MVYKPVDAAITMVVGPCIDDTDFKSLEEAIAYDVAGMDVSLIVEKTDGTTAVTAITLTSGGTSDWTHKDGGYYEVEITAAQNIEEGVGYVRGVCTGVLPFESAHYSIVKANVYDSLVKGTDVLQVDVTQLAGVVQSLTDLKDFADAGYDPAANKINGVVLVDTTTTNTDMVGTNSAALATALTTHDGKLDTVDTVVDGIQTDLSNATDGLGALKALIDTVDGVVDTILVDTAELQANQGAWATAVGFSTHSAANVWAVASRILTASTNFNDLNAAAVKAEVVAALADIKLDHLINIAVDTNWATTVHLDSVIGHMADVGTAATFSRTTDSQEAIRNHGDSAWLTATGFNTTTPPTTAEIKTAIEQAGSSIAQILADTDNLQTNQGAWTTATGFNTVTPDAAGVTPTAVEIRQEMDSNSTKMAPSQTLDDYKATGFNTVVPDAAGVAPTAAEIKTAVEQAGSSIAQILEDTGTTLDVMLQRILGLNQENFYIDTAVFSSGNMTSCRIRTYSVAGSVGTASDVLATYTMTATYSGSDMSSYKLVKA